MNHSRMFTTVVFPARIRRVAWLGCFALVCACDFAALQDNANVLVDPEPSHLAEKRQLVAGQYQDLGMLPRSDDEDIIVARTVAERPHLHMISSTSGIICDLGESEGYVAHWESEWGLDPYVASTSPELDDGNRQLRFVDADCNDVVGPFQVKSAPVIADVHWIPPFSPEWRKSVTGYYFVDSKSRLLRYTPYDNEVVEVATDVRSLEGDSFDWSSDRFGTVYYEGIDRTPHRISYRGSASQPGFDTLSTVSLLGFEDHRSILRYERFNGATVADVVRNDGENAVDIGEEVLLPGCAARLLGSSSSVVWEYPCGSGNAYLRHGYRIVNYFAVPPLISSSAIAFGTCSDSACEFLFLGSEHPNGGQRVFRATAPAAGGGGGGYEALPALEVEELEELGGGLCRNRWYENEGGYEWRCLLNINGTLGTLVEVVAQPKESRKLVFQSIREDVEDWYDDLVLGTWEGTSGSLMRIGEKTTLFASGSLPPSGEEKHPRQGLVEPIYGEHIIKQDQGDVLVEDVVDNSGVIRLDSKVFATDVAPGTAHWIHGADAVGYQSTDGSLHVLFIDSALDLSLIHI